MRSVFNRTPSPSASVHALYAAAMEPAVPLSLLRRYMALVYECEGTTFAHHPESRFSPFSDDEWALLMRVSKEVAEAGPPSSE